MRVRIQMLIMIGTLISLTTALPAPAQDSGTAPAGEPAAPARTEPVPIITIDEERLIERVKEVVIEELRRDGFLDAEIEKGIRAYVQKQREAQQAARAARDEQLAELAKNVRRPSPERDHIFGDRQAVISLIEYSDFECPFCKRFHPTPRQVVEASGGKVNWIYRHYPLEMHNPGAQKQAEASECAAKLGGNEAFWRFTDAIYERTRSGGKGFPLEQLAPLAEEIGLNGKAFRACLDSGEQAAQVQEDFEEGARIGVSGTPATILLNNQTGAVKIIRGAASADTLNAAIQELH